MPSDATVKIRLIAVYTILIVRHGDGCVVNDIDKNSTNWLSTLVSLSQVPEQGDQVYVFDYPPLQFDDVKTHFTELGSPTGLSLGLGVLAYVLMLLSWFVAKRSTRAAGVLTTKSYEVVL